MSSTILDQIGNTPLIRLERCVPANSAEVWLKLEYRNPTGSMKDRMALSMIEGAEREGLIDRETTIVEYTGGSTGRARAQCTSEDDEALEMTVRVAREEGVFAGISTGANVVASLRLAERLGSDAVVVTIAVDTGFKSTSVAPYAAQQ